MVQRVVGIDWSGRVDAAGQRRHIWAGVWTEAARGKVSVRLEAGRTRAEIAEWLIEMAKEYVARKRMKKPEGDKEIARAMRRLMGAGFSTKTIWKVLRSWGAEVEEVDVVDDEE